MNTLDQAKIIRKGLVKIIKVYTPYEGKNLNRYKNLPTIEALNMELKNNPLPMEWNGLFSFAMPQWDNVDLTHLRDKLADIENVIHSVDLFESSYKEEYKEIKEQILDLCKKQRQIMRACEGIPSYMFDDLI